jgi:transmembrane sensor
MKEETATYLILERLKGTISMSDAEKLDAWLAISKDNILLSKKIERTWELSLQAEDENSVSFDKEADYNQILGKIKQTKSAPNLKIVHKRRSWLSIAAAILFLLSAGALFWKIYQFSPEMLEFATKIGEKKDILLPDGSHIWLNENTKIAYPKQWTSDIRLVNCEGEAYFEVAKDAAHPFVVHTQLGEVRVLGTTFMVNQKSDSKILEVAVKEGKVAVTVEKIGKKAELVAGDAIRFDETAKTLTRLENPADAIFTWKTGEFSFDALSLSEVAEVLEQLYKAKIKFTNPALQSCKYSSRYTTNLPISAIVKDICVVFGATSKMSGNEIEIVGGSCK